MRIEITQTQRDALAAFSPHPEMVALVEAFDAARAELTSEAGTIKDARSTYTSDDVEIDGEPAVSVTDGGTWVAAWVWVAQPDGSEDEEED